MRPCPVECVIRLTLPLLSQTYYSARDFRLTDVQIWPFVTAAAPTVLLDGCSTIPESAPADLSNLVVIVKRGGCSLEIKFRNLSRSRVRYVLVANTGLAPFYPTGFGIERAALIEGEDAELVSADFMRAHTCTF